MRFRSFENTFTDFDAFWLCVESKTIENADRFHRKRTIHSETHFRLETFENGALSYQCGHENQSSFVKGNVRNATNIAGRLFLACTDDSCNVSSYM